ncbi:hypothetical protein M9Y10_007320 [Tritrichomonas musculus]|uniref:Uncharacterized protein n=1 Tax=Tritrichomonas musculus TaxID=1915356 RepID=A0ABR2J202_9EUKA
MYNYAKMLLESNGIENNDEESLKYLKMAAEIGHVDSMHTYDCILLGGDHKEAAKYFKLGADHGQIDSMYNYARIMKVMKVQCSSMPQCYIMEKV